MCHTLIHLGPSCIFWDFLPAISIPDNFPAVNFLLRLTTFNKLQISPFTACKMCTLSRCTFSSLLLSGICIAVRGERMVELCSKASLHFWLSSVSVWLRLTGIWRSSCILQNGLQYIYFRLLVGLVSIWNLRMKNWKLNPKLNMSESESLCYILYVQLYIHTQVRTAAMILWRS